MANGASPRARSQLRKRGSGVYQIWRPSAAAPIPERPAGFEVFMDSIVLTSPIERLTIGQIADLNAIRRSLMLSTAVGSVNLKVRRALAAALHAAGSATDVLEWGCGYHTMAELLPGANLTCVDIDPEVVRHWKRNGHRHTFHTDTALRRFRRGTFDAVVSSFVFHFRMPTAHVAKMREVLRPDGFVLANVYRRDAVSRQRLRSGFEQLGLTVVAQPDPAHLCTNHEIWFIGRRTDENFDLRADRALTAAVRELAAACSTPRNAPPGQNPPRLPT